MRNIAIIALSVVLAFSVSFSIVTTNKLKKERDDAREYIYSMNNIIIENHYKYFNLASSSSSKIDKMRNRIKKLKNKPPRIVYKDRIVYKYIESDESGWFIVEDDEPEVYYEIEYPDDFWDEPGSGLDPERTDGYYPSTPPAIE